MKTLVTIESQPSGPVAALSSSHHRSLPPSQYGLDPDMIASGADHRHFG